MSQIADELNEAVNASEAKLRAISEEASARRPGPRKWSAREIIGHLVDSALNNHVRFARAALEDDLVFPGYAQNEWVTLQNYQGREWSELVGLWAANNRHIAALVAGISEYAMTRPRAKHNLDRIAWNSVVATQPVTLEYFVRDYIAHMKHHLGQINDD